MHALIIEQDTWIILMIEDILSAIGYTSFAFASSPEAAERAMRARRPDLITSDVRFGSGIGVAPVRRLCSAMAVPVVFVTATPWEVREIDPVAVVVPKPFCHDMLVEGVTRATVARAANSPRLCPDSPAPA